MTLFGEKIKKSPSKRISPTFGQKIECVGEQSNNGRISYPSQNFWCYRETFELEQTLGRA